jgi:DNA (cytosine-5)-methyltransferase 1
MTPKFKIASLFSGCGGLDLGFTGGFSFLDNNFEKLPTEVVFANDFDKDATTCYNSNELLVSDGAKCLLEDIRNINAEDIPDFDILLAGFPCQPFSNAGNRKGVNDDNGRGTLFEECERIIRHKVEIGKTPTAFVFENVVGILSMDKGKLFKQIQAEFEELGYTLKHKVLNAVDFGVPQQRERVILVGFRGENNFEYPEPTHGDGLKPHVTLRQAIGDLPVLKSGQSSSRYAYQADNDFLHFVRASAQELTEHSAPKNGDHLIRIMEALKDGQCKDDLPEDIRPKSGYGNTYAKLWWDRPSTTITRNFSCPSSSRCIHPRDSRAMSIREGARLQSFPDDYKFYGSDGVKRLEIGNAVPPLLSMAIAKKVLEALEGE